MQLSVELEEATRTLGDTMPRRPRRQPMVARRVASIDLLRGLVIVIMALDHVREFFSISQFSPTDLSQTTAPLFLTRWITHLCAPTFVLLAGVSAFLSGRKRTPAELSRFLLTRGLWLVALELTVVNFGWYFNFRYEIGFVGQVIWAIGISMVVLAGLVHLPRVAIAMVGLVLIAGHNLLDRFDSVLGGSFWYAVLHVQRPFPDLHFFVLYPVLPWIGVMAAGYTLGPLFTQPASVRNRSLIATGLGACTLFVALRLLGVYGEPSAWVPQTTPLFSAFSFVNASKYPPSLLYLLMTLGPALLAIPLLDRLRGGAADFLAAFGRAPLFFYVVHIYLLHAATVIIGLLAGYHADQMRVLFLNLPKDFGISLPGIYLLWIGALAVLYYPTRWWGELKARGTSRWWGYL